MFSGYSAMLQQSELIFDFASDHVNMSQVSKCFVCVLVLEQSCDTRQIWSENPILSDLIWILLCVCWNRAATGISEESNTIIIWCNIISVCVLQFGGHSDYPAVIVEQVPHHNLLSYAGLACEQSHTGFDHHQLLKGQCAHTQADRQTDRQTDRHTLSLSH